MPSSRPSTLTRLPSKLLSQLRGLLLMAPWLSYLFLADLLLSLLLPLKAVAPTLTYNLSSRIAGSVWHWIQAIFTRYNRAKVVISGDALPAGESAIVLANHRTWTDFYLIQEVARRKGMLERCRWFAKRELKWVPFLGWGLWAMGMPLVSRRWVEDKAELEKVFGGIKGGGWPVWLISFNEGTRFTPARHANTVSFLQKARSQTSANTTSSSSAAATHLPTHTLWPRPRGFVATVTSLRQAPQVKAVYDMTIAYAHGDKFMRAPSFWDTIAAPWGGLDRAGYKFYVHVKRFEIKDLPQGDEELVRWLEGRWVAKDEKLEEVKRGLEKGSWGVE